MDKQLKAHLEYLLCIQIVRVKPLAGGDISKAFVLETDTERFFCKTNPSEHAYAMFKAEKEALQVIKNTKTIATPYVFLCERLEKGALLIMEYVVFKPSSSKEMELFGHQLGAMHRISASKTFGWQNHNFIGSLHQSNTEHATWTAFFVNERLIPQLKLAQDGNRLQASEIPSEERLQNICSNIFPETTPSLLHGDLWSGNYLISTNGTPYLIDAAAYYGHHQVDIAMSRLFGGFKASFYRAYQEILPKPPLEKDLDNLYQLYYILVHLNLFGTSYYEQVTAILKRYF